MANQVRILLQTTIADVADDWDIERFSLLLNHLESIKNDDGTTAYEVTTRDQESNHGGDDILLSVLDTSDFNQLWLFAVESGNGLSEADCRGITRFRQRGGGIMATRDHH